jgi:hypothetical protein
MTDDEKKSLKEKIDPVTSEVYGVAGLVDALEKALSADDSIAAADITKAIKRALARVDGGLDKLCLI